MEIKGDQIWHSPSPAELLAAAGQEITLKACVHNIRELGGIAFVVLRTGRYLIQSVYDKEVCPDNNLSQLSAGDCVRATGLLRAEPRAENGVELLLHGFTVLSRPASPLPLNLADKELKATLGTKMEYRTVALRHPRERAVFRIQQALACGFREFMLSQDFTEIHTPKITGIGAEGGAEVSSWTTSACPPRWRRARRCTNRPVSLFSTACLKWEPSIGRSCTTPAAI